MIARDRRGQFRFGALQSAAGRSALEQGSRAASGSTKSVEIPDSVVLIDEAGIHTRSEAALRMARRLGFPWSILQVARLLPRSLRDAIYDWVAQNRYGWFGKQNACMIPTPELRSRFLSGVDEVTTCEAPDSRPNGVDIGSSQGVAPRTAWGSVASFFCRWFTAYLVLYVFPFPIGTIPYAGPLAGWYTTAQQGMVTWIAKEVCGIAITVYPAGSGDTTYNYIEFATYLSLAAVLALLWTLVRRGGRLEPRVKEWSYHYVRYFLAVTMLSYGWHKVMPVQMSAPGPDRLLIPIGDTSPMGLLWTLMGASSAYQVFAGLGEAIGGFLLLWRRTTLLGAAIAAGVMANVVALNYCYDVPVKLFSSHLLVMAIY
ncbi:MAG TPA: DCC1-like thiol-disulfide oxidoreductase family protein, partial [Pirellulaceae bacterium]